MPWYEYSPTPGGTSLPLVEVLLWHGARHVRLVALVDSGADSSLVDASYADVLGLARADAASTTGMTAGGSAITCLRWPNLEIQFGTDRFPFEGSFVEFPPDADPMNLLGRRDFFQRYIVQFWDAAELFSIDVSPDFPANRPTP